MQIIIMGMHRSGASAVAGVVTLMGAYFGETDEAATPEPGDPLGPMERKDVQAINDEIIRQARGRWDAVSEFDLGHLSPELRTSLRERMQQLIAKIDAYQPWFIKDTRFSLTFPLWREHLPETVCVMVERNPLQIAGSLRRRGACSVQTGLALWEYHTRCALAHTAGLRRVVYSFESLIADPMPRIADLIETLRSAGVVGLRVPDDDEIAQWIDASHVRQHETDAQFRRQATRSQIELYDALCSGAAFEQDFDPAVSGAAMAVLKDHEALVARRAARIEELESVATRSKQAAEESAQSARRASTTLEETAQQVARLLNSAAWRIGRALTAPLRGGKRPAEEQALKRLMEEGRAARNETPKNRS